MTSNRSIAATVATTSRHAQRISRYKIDSLAITNTYSQANGSKGSLSTQNLATPTRKKPNLRKISFPSHAVPCTVHATKHENLLANGALQRLRLSFTSKGHVANCRPAKAQDGDEWPVLDEQDEGHRQCDHPGPTKDHSGRFQQRTHQW